MSHLTRVAQLIKLRCLHFERSFRVLQIRPNSANTFHKLFVRSKVSARFLRFLLGPLITPGTGCPPQALTPSRPNFRFTWTFDVRKELSTRKALPIVGAEAYRATKPWRWPCGGRDSTRKKIRTTPRTGLGGALNVAIGRTPFVWTRRRGRGRTLSLDDRLEPAAAGLRSPGGTLDHEFLPKEQLV